MLIYTYIGPCDTASTFYSFLLLVSIPDWSTNIIPACPQEERIKVKFVNLVKPTIGTKSVLR